MSIDISIRRFDPDADTEPRWVDYTVPVVERMTVLEALMHIYEDIDPTLAFRFGCRFGACGLCAVEVNGKPRMACSTEIKDGMKIAPLAGLPVARDLVIDRAAFFDGLRELQLYIPEQEGISEPKTIKQPEAHKKLLECVECLACNASCPNYDFEKNALIGPYVFVKLAQLHLDPRNTIDRRKQAKELGGEDCGACEACRCINGINIRRDVFGTLMDG